VETAPARGFGRRWHKRGHLLRSSRRATGAEAKGRHKEAVLTEQRRSARELARIQDLRAFERTIEHVSHLVAELDSSRGAAAAVQERLFTAISRELSQLRQRALAAGISGVDQQAGALAVLARSGIGLAFRIRALSEGVASLSTEIDLELKRVTFPPPRPPKT